MYIVYQTLYVGAGDLTQVIMPAEQVPCPPFSQALHL